LRDDGRDVTEAPCAEQALKLFRDNPFPVVVTDIIMGKMNGLELLQEIKLIEPDTQVVVMTSNASLETATTALRNGAYDYLIKPFEEIDLITAVTNRAAEKVELIRQNRVMVDRLKRNAEELERLNHELQDLAIRDGLTGLFNHRYFRESLGTELSRSSRHGRAFSVIFMDVDHFKHYNDANGHLAGDEVLRTLSTLISERARDTTVSARYGGEEFVLLLPETDKEGAKTYAEELRGRIETYAFPDEKSQPLGRITLSLGVSTYPEDGCDADTLISHADQALYHAKDAGRNAVRW